MTHEMDRNQPTAAQHLPLLGDTAAKTQRGSAPSLFKRLGKMQLAVEGASNDAALAGLLAPFGYSQERIATEGRQLIAEVQQRMSEQSLATGDMFSAKDERDRVYGIARKQYSRDVGLARFALRDDRGAMQKLELHAQRKVTTMAWLMQARQFYSAAVGDPLILQRLTAAGLTLEMLEGGRGLVASVDHCLVRQAATRSAAKEATQRRNEAVRRMDAWMSDFRAIARVALRGRPELLKQLGM